MPEQGETERAMYEALEDRLRALEDQFAVQRLVMSYGPAADGGLAARAAQLWLEDGTYDWDANHEPYRGREAVAAMLQGEQHATLSRNGAAHLALPPIVEVDGDRAVAITYSLVVARDEGRYNLWRVSANRWELRKVGDSWGVLSRTNRAMDETGAGRQLLREALTQASAGGDDADQPQ